VDGLVDVRLVCGFVEWG